MRTRWPISIAAGPSIWSSATDPAAAMISARGWWRGISAATFPAIRPSWCRTCRGRAACARRIISTRSPRMTAPRSAPSPATCRCWPSSATCPGVRFDPRKFVWLGSSSNFANDAHILMVRSDAPVKSIEDARRAGGPPLVLGSTAEGTSGSDVPTLLRDTLGLNIKLVAGYPDNGAIFLAVDRGEVNGRTVDLTTMKALRPDWLKPDGGMHALVQFARATRHPDFPDVPTARELAGTETVAGADRARGVALFDGAPLRRAARRPGRPRGGAAGGLSRGASRSAIPGRCGAAQDRGGRGRRGRGSRAPSTGSPTPLAISSIGSAGCSPSNEVATPHGDGDCAAFRML